VRRGTGSGVNTAHRTNEREVSMTEQVELKACPFCGAAAKKARAPGGKAAIGCANRCCHVTALVVAGNEYEAARLWNRRAPGGRTELAEALRGLMLRGVITDADVERLEREGVRHACV